MSQQSLLCAHCDRWACAACRERLARATRKGSLFRSIYGAICARAEKIEQAARAEPDIRPEMIILAVASLLIGAVAVYLIHLFTSIFF